MSLYCLVYTSIASQKMSNDDLMRIPSQSCHPFQTNAATHSILKLPLIPVNLKKSVEFNPAENIQHKLGRLTGGMNYI